jgi:ubiquinone/menaquinone biosynthesis C-methylase UbiE
MQLVLGKAEHLLMADEAFDIVFHIGGISFFNDKRLALIEMVRVARPGANIVVVDENEKGARSYEWTLAGFKGSFHDRPEPIRPPVGVLPTGVVDVRLSDVGDGWFYRLEFRKP